MLCFKDSSHPELLSLSLFVLIQRVSYKPRESRRQKASAIRWHFSYFYGYCHHEDGVKKVGLPKILTHSRCDLLLMCFNFCPKTPFEGLKVQNDETRTNITWGGCRDRRIWTESFHHQNQTKFFWRLHLHFIKDPDNKTTGLSFI